MPDGFRPIAQLLVEACKIEVRVGKAAVHVDGLAIRGQGIVPSPKLLQSCSQIECTGGIGARRTDREAVMLDRILDLSGQLEQPPEIHVSIDEARVVGQSL